MLEFRTFDLTVSDKVALVTLNRPQQMNTFNAAMRQDFLDLFDHTDAEDDIRAIVVTGTGKAFCAGLDLSAKANTFDFAKAGREPSDYRDGGGQVAMRIFDSLKPTICAINGAAIGFGATIPLAMDIRLASRNARFGYVFASRGITPEACSSWFLPRTVGVSTALEWCYTGRIFGAQEALDAGLIRSMYEPDELLSAALALAREIAENTAPVSTALIRQMMWRLAAADHPREAHRIETAALLARGGKADAVEGIASFFEKRPPSFSGKVSTDLPDFYPWWSQPGT